MGSGKIVSQKLRSRSLITGLKSVVNMYRSYGTFLTMKKDFVLYYLVTGLKPVVNMYRSSGTSSPNFCPLFSGRLTSQILH